MKPYSTSCEDNKEIILSVITPYLANKTTVLEIASGTGQHAIFFAQHLTHITWQTSDLLPQLKGIQLWLDEALLDNVLSPIELDVSARWPDAHYDAVFSANALHIMSYQQVEDCFIGLGNALQKNAVCLFYGPFNYNGLYTSDSNESFDVWLKNNNIQSGIKDFERICKLAKSQDLILAEDHEMPANNRLLVFIKNQ